MIIRHGRWVRRYMQVALIRTGEGEGGCIGVTIAMGIFVIRGIVEETEIKQAVHLLYDT